jgi:hypothetical protein
LWRVTLPPPPTDSSLGDVDVDVSSNVFRLLLSRAGSKIADRLAGPKTTLAGLLIVGLLVCFSLARGIRSVTAKDVLGKTTPKSTRA